MFVTLTVMRGAHYLTVVCTYNHAYGWVVDASIDEYGNTVMTMRLKAGALGLPTWGLIPYSPDWRWMLQRDDSPWYPTLRLFRQPQPGDWQSVFECISLEVPAAMARAAQGQG